MPEATRIEVTTLAAQKAAELVKAEEQAVLPLALCNVVSPDAIDGNRRSKALRKADLLRLYIAHMKRYGKSIKERERFIGLYLDNTWPEILTVVGGKISWKTIETWKRTIRQTNDVAAIADKRGLAHRGKSILTERHRTIMLGLLLNPKAQNNAQCARKAQLRCGDEGLRVPS